MIKRISLLILILFIAFSIRRLYINYLTTTGIIERVTNVHLPFWTSTIETYDNWEFLLTGKYILPSRAIDSFCEEYNLAQLGNNNLNFMGLKEENRPNFENP